MHHFWWVIQDDQAVNREILCSIFNDEYRVLQAEDGQAALDILSAERKRIAVILLDVIMPVMDGFGVIRAMSTDGDLKRIPVVLITGDRSDQTESVERCTIFGGSFRYDGRLSIDWYGRLHPAHSNGTVRMRAATNSVQQVTELNDAPFLVGHSGLWKPFFMIFIDYSPYP